MNNITQLFNNLKSAVKSMDKKNKTILSIVSVAVIAAMTFAGYSLTTIGKTVDDKVKQSDTKNEDAPKKDTKNESDKDVELKGEKENKKKESSKSDSDKEENKKESETSASTNKTSSSSSQTSKKSNSNESGSNSNSSSSNNTQTTPDPTPEPEPAPQPTEPTEAEKQAQKEANKQAIIAQAEQSPGGLFKTMDEASKWATDQANDPNSPYYGKIPGAGEVGDGAETYGYVGYFY